MKKVKRNRSYKKYIKKQIKKALQEKNLEYKILKNITSDLMKALEIIN